MTEFLYRYPHISLLLSMRPSPRVLLGRRLFWTEKEDGSCMALYWTTKKRFIRRSKIELQISSHNQFEAAQDLRNLVLRTEDCHKIIKLLEDNPQYVVYCEACKKGRSVTGVKVYDRDTLYVFDIYDRAAEQFLNYTAVYQHCYHYSIPCVKLYAETRHRTMKDLLKFKNHVLEYCESMRIEGMVAKIDPEPKTYYQAKVKLDVPEPVLRKISKGNAILPPIPEPEIMGAIDHVYQELGTEKFKDVKLAMPLIAKEVSEECRKHLFSSAKGKLYDFYQKYLERLV
jgi:hypothetical protein